MVLCSKLGRVRRFDSVFADDLTRGFLSGGSQRFYPWFFSLQLTQGVSELMWYISYDRRFNNK